MSGLRPGENRFGLTARPPRRPSLGERLRGVPLASGAAYVLAMAVLAAAAAWPIYQTPYFFITAAGAAALGVGIAGLSLVQGWSWFTTLLATLGAYLVFGVPLAVPSSLGLGPELLRGLGELLMRSVFGWKELVTISLPVGSYQALLVPFFAVMLGTIVLSLSFVWRSRRLDLLAVPLMLAAVAFGILFGSSLMSPAWSVAGLTLPAPRETVIGAAAFLLSLGFLTGRARRARRAAQMHRVASGAGKRSFAGSARRASRSALTIGVLVAAIAIAVPVAAVPLRVDQRDVLRTSIEPELALREFVSPLSTYRGFLSDDRLNTELLRVTASGASAERLRVAVLSYYDGEVFRVVDPARGIGERSTAFARTPGLAVGATAASTLEVGIAEYSEVWMPLAGQLSRVDFHGKRKQALTDGFFYNEQTAAGVQLNQLRPGDSFTLRTNAPAAQPGDLAAAQKPRDRSERVEETLFPESLDKWVAAQGLGSTDGAALQELITRLRERGYLSHALTSAGPAGYAWQQERGNIGFAPSLAGHSVGRIDMLFSSLLDKQNTTSSTDNADLVAAVGDDEQFAVAAALIAESLGFPARVVLGFHLDDGTAGASASGMPACAAGSCSGRNLSAWIEVQEAGGGWIPVDVTPQYENPISPRDEQTRDPQNTTEVISDGATEVTPPEADPAGGGETPDEPAEESADLAWLLTALRIVGLVLLGLLVVGAPLVAATAAKALRRRARRTAAGTTERIAGGWDDYVDTAVDLGLPAPGSDTRTELAARYDSPNGHMIAVLADEAVFGPVAPGPAESDAYWAAVDAERALLTQEFTRWQRMRARLSLRSFGRGVRAKKARNG
ncbi:DUF3488 and transglutaminase-like domain-containing protein [Microterricola viridarii]|uniref:Transglutaminase-like superfamily protein n=1 Tax=Microterricola viridarii TaxID=412690 RepID=A0A1H1PV46_9MICO|nr:transglutaminase domain-containing protein [Microterricola viridarii]SDS15014.1 Transglutaminase-like superfamily protein [Microterricola viridarii]